MISVKSLLHFKLILDTSQIFRSFEIYFLPYEWNSTENRVDLVPKLKNWRIFGVMSLLFLVGNMLVILIGLLAFTKLDAMNLIVAIWIETILFTALVCQLHLNLHYQEIFQWIHCILHFNQNLKKQHSISSLEKDGLEQYQMYFGLGVIVTMFIFAPSIFFILETELLSMARIVTMWESRLLNLAISCGGEILVFFAWIHVCFYAFLLIPGYFNYSKGWLKILGNRNHKHRGIHSRQELRLTYITLHYFNCWFASLLMILVEISLIVIDSLVISAVYSIIKLNRTLNVFALIGLVATAGQSMIGLHLLLREANHLKDTSQIFISSSIPANYDFGSDVLNRKQQFELKCHQSLREIGPRIFNIPVHNGMFLVIMNSIILSILINMLLMF